MPRPIAWAIYHGEKSSGVTIIKMSVYLDAGDMVAQEAIDIGPDETAGEVEARLAPLGAKLALQVIEQIAAGAALPGLKQDKAQVTKAPKLTKEHGLIDWTRYYFEVVAQVRAMQPWPTAYTFLHRPGQPPTRIIVHRAFPYHSTFVPGKEAAPPGTVRLRPEAPLRLFVWAGRGSEVEILELQPAGKRRMAAIDFLRGHPLKPGDHFGPETA